MIAPTLRAAGLVLTCLCLPACAAANDTSPWVPVDSATLDDARGGFLAPSGLEVSLGIERLVSLNGEVVARTQLTIPDVGKLDVQQAREAQQALSAINLVRNDGNASGQMALPVHIASTAGATLIQNSLNGQQIDSRTVINSSVNTLGLLTSLNFQGSLGDAIARSARPF
jgi:hypothetical protein